MLPLAAGRCGFTAFGVIAVCFLCATLASGQTPSRADELGDVHFSVSCPDAQAHFDRAVALLHHMTYDDARAAFTSIAERFPSCAMAHWGVAMTLFQPLWPTRPSASDIQRGWQEVTRAREIGLPTPREQKFNDMAAAFFDPAAGDYWDRIRRWEEAAKALVVAFPEDGEAAAFYALAHLATAPATGPAAHHTAAAELLARVLATQPRHPGALHYMIHANDANGRERESPGVVQLYGDIAPRNPHALHMPTHIFVRLGEWEAVIEWNRRAADAALEHPAGDRKQWVWDEFPHTLEYMVYAYLQRGDDVAALQAMTRLQKTTDLEPTFKTAFHLSSIPARYTLERQDWAGAMRLEPEPESTLDWNRFPWPVAVTWFARGVGAARSADVQAAAAAETHLAQLRDASQRAGETLFEKQTEILRLGVAAWLAQAKGNASEATRLMREAAELEKNTPKHAVTPAPTLPALEMLGDLLMEQRRPSEALESYRASLSSQPRRFNSLLGAARAAGALGDSALARSFYRELRQMAAPSSERPGVHEAARSTS